MVLLRMPDRPANLRNNFLTKRVGFKLYRALQTDAHGFDSAIMDPFDKEIMAVLKTGEMLKGNDNFCMNFLKNVRAGNIES